MEQINLGPSKIKTWLNYLSIHIAKVQKDSQLQTPWYISLNIQRLNSNQQKDNDKISYQSQRTKTKKEKKKITQKKKNLSVQKAITQLTTPCHDKVLWSPKDSVFIISLQVEKSL